MQSGRQTLGSIDSALASARDELARVDHEVQATSTELIAVQSEQMDRYKRLAKLRLDEILSGSLASELDAVTRRVRELLDRRSGELSQLESDMAEAREAQAELEHSREQLANEVDEAEKSLEHIEAEVQASLKEDEAFKSQLEKAQRADDMAARAEDKASEAERNRAEKGAPYEQDPLFSYLWKRGYGTSGYTANALFRFLDQWVAKLCGYQQARPNYAMLLEIPVRLRAHAQALRESADREFEAVRALEEEALDEGGIKPVRESLAAFENDLEQLDVRIQENEIRLQALSARRTEFASGSDDSMREAMETMYQAIERENLEVLFRYAAATATSEDDVLVQEMAAARTRTKELEQALKEHRRLYERHLARMEELEDVRHRFKRERYDSRQSGFDNAALIALVLNEFLKGMSSQDDLWRTIQREQRRKPSPADPTFGSGRIGGGTWRSPFPRGRGGFGRGGGGFRTGGGF